MKIGIPFYLLPFLFARDSTLFLQGPILHIIFVTIKVCMGNAAIACGMAGYLLSRLGRVDRVLLVVGGVSLCFSLLGSEFFGAVFIAIPLYKQLAERTRLRKVPKLFVDRGVVNKF